MELKSGGMKFLSVLNEALNRLILLTSQSKQKEGPLKREHLIKHKRQGWSDQKTNRAYRGVDFPEGKSIPPGRQVMSRICFVASQGFVGSQLASGGGSSGKSKCSATMA
jgi:hypothetical protein